MLRLHIGELEHLLICITMYRDSKLLLYSINQTVTGFIHVNKSVSCPITRVITQEELFAF